MAKDSEHLSNSVMVKEGFKRTGGRSQSKSEAGGKKLVNSEAMYRNERHLQEHFGISGLNPYKPPETKEERAGENSAPTKPLL